MKESDVAEERRSMTKAEFEQEYMASFSTFEGQIYKGFNTDTQIKDYVPADRDEPLAGMDPGYKDPTAFVCIIYSPSTSTFHIVDEYLEAEAVTSTHVESFRLLIDKWGLDPIFIDPAAAQFAADLAYSYDIATVKAKKAVNEGIAYVQTLIEQDRLFVAPHCTNTLRMLDQYHWKLDVQSGIEKPDHTIDSHIADAIRYAIYTFTI
jgi:phage terminase large subunit